MGDTLAIALILSSSKVLRGWTAIVGHGSSVPGDWFRDKEVSGSGQ